MGGEAVSISMPVVFLVHRVVGQVFAPFSRFGNLLDDRIPFAQQGKHIAAKEEDLGYLAQQWQRRGHAEIISHFGCARGKSLEPMIRLHEAKDAADHGDLKVSGSLQSGCLAGQVLPKIKMSCPPGDLLAETDQARGDAAGSDCLFS